MTPEVPQFTHEEIEKMRALVNAHDKASLPKEFDLNNPPKGQYRFQKFPKMVYDHDRRTHHIVRNQAELDAALAKGLKEEPFPNELPEDTAPELDEATQAEVAALDKIARQPKKKKAE